MDIVPMLIFLERYVHYAFEGVPFRNPRDPYPRIP